MYANILVEGVLDEHVARRILDEFGVCVAQVYGKRGMPYIRKKIQNFDKGSRGMPLFTMADLDASGHECAPDLVRCWLPSPSLKHIFRVAVYEVEAWLLADRQSLSKFLSVSAAKFPTRPEGLLDPKLTLMNLSRKSKSRRIREDIPPKQRGSAKEGPLYNDYMMRYVKDFWDPNAAARQSDSLARCLSCIREYVENAD